MHTFSYSSKGARMGFNHPCWVALMMLSLPLSAKAADFAIKLEPGVAILLSPPQSERFDIGGGESFKLLFGLNPYLDIGPSSSFHYLPSVEPDAEGGVQWGLGGGLRLKRPHDAESAGGISPWLDADALYIRTGPLNRPGFDAAVGLSVPLGEERRYWMGPFARYLQIVQPVRDGYDNRDSKMLVLGLSLEVGSPGIEDEPCVAQAPPEVVIQEVASCPDRDGDGVTDCDDRCPDVVGTTDLQGCPAYEKVVVHANKIELKENVYFAWDEARIDEVSTPVLDDVAKALKDDPSIRLRIEGHTDSSGSESYNQRLSERRAAAVLDYVVAKGIASDRLVSQGFGESVPIGTNGTVESREDNRRVEFVITSNTVADGSAQ